MSQILYTAEGAIRQNGQVKCARNKGITMHNAKRNVVKSLANKFRFDEEEVWVIWKNLSKYEQNVLLDTVIDLLIWTDKTNSHTELTNITSKEFTNIWNKGVA
jgi:hypothetical protein